MIRIVDDRRVLSKGNRVKGNTFGVVIHGQCILILHKIGDQTLSVINHVQEVKTGSFFVYTNSSTFDH